MTTITPRYAPVGPICVLEYLAVHHPSAFGSYHLALAHEVAAHKKRYRRLYGELLSGGWPRCVILDNGAVELGEPMDASTLLELADYINADVVCIPDVLRERDSTLHAAMDFKSIYDFDLNKGTKMPALMGIPQGSDHHEIFDCAQSLWDLFEGKIAYWGVPRWIVHENGPYERDVVVQELSREFRNVKIHLLGMSHFPAHDIALAYENVYKNITGIDSGYPIALGFHGIIFRAKGHERLDVSMENYYQQGLPVGEDQVDFYRRLKLIGDNLITAQVAVTAGPNCA